MRTTFIAIGVGIVLVLVLLYSSIFIVNPTQQALVLQFGEVRNAIREPGPKLKVPFIQDVLFLDKRILDLNVPAQEIIAADQKRLVVDAFARYRIENPVLFYQSVNNVAEGASRLSTFVQSSLRAVLADATFQSIVRDDRPALMNRIRDNAQSAAANIGIEVVDVKIRRADLPEANSLAIYRRMQTERQQEAEQIRAEGEEAARRIRAQADRQATVIMAQANQLAEQLRGEGDAKRNAIFADAFGRDPQFFRFYRSMQAYERGLQDTGTRMVISPDSDFFRYFNDPLGGAPLAIGATPPEGGGETAPLSDTLVPEVRELLPDAPDAESGADAATPEGADEATGEETMEPAPGEEAMDGEGPAGEEARAEPAAGPVVAAAPGEGEAEAIDGGAGEPATR